VYRRPTCDARDKICAGRADFTPVERCARGSPGVWAQADRLTGRGKAFNPAPGRKAETVPPHLQSGAAIAPKRRSHSKERQENFYDYDRRVEG
jgi:hypothetical protein